MWEQLVDDVALAVTKKLCDASEDETSVDASLCARFAMTVLRLPEEIEKMCMYNMMVEANRLIVSPTTFYEEHLPNILTRIGGLVKCDIFSPADCHTLLWKIPSFDSGCPALEIMQYDTEQKKVKRWIVSVCLDEESEGKRVDSVIGPHPFVLGTWAQSGYAKAAPYSDESTYAQHMGMTCQEYFMEYANCFAGKPPRMTSAMKRKTDNLTPLDVCTMSKRLLCNKRTVVRVNGGAACTRE